MILEVFAISMTYLIFSMPFAFATEINMIYGVSSDTVQLNPGDIATKSISLNGNDVSVSLGGDNIEKVQVYKCTDKNPKECIDAGDYDSSSGDFLKTYPFSDISSDDVANILMLVKTRVGGAVGWIGFWEEVMKTGSVLFKVNRELDRVNLYTNSIGRFSFIRDFVRINEIVPFRSDITERAVFADSNKLYIIKGDEAEMDSASFRTSESYASAVETIDADFWVVFSENDNGVYNPITLHNVTDYHCGFGPGYDSPGEKCEGSIGENSVNCCLDCGCGVESDYCDIGKGCKDLDSITLSISGNTGITNCKVDNEIELSVIIDNEPSGINLDSVMYRLNQTTLPTTCAKVREVYKCNITLFADPDCDSGTFTIGPNSLVMDTNFPDGADTVYKTLEGNFDDITVVSWFPADGECQRDLGENEQNSCYDCDCVTGYCDYNVSDHTQAECRLDPIDSDLVIIEANPLSFYKGTSTEIVNLLINIQNKPKTMSVVSTTCSTECTADRTPCISTCTLTCSGLPSSDTNIYNATCSLRFQVLEYNSSKVYTLNPDIAVNISYMDGTHGALLKRLEASAPGISIGLMQCGNRICDEPWETSNNCCYDCGCDDGYYCSTQDLGGFTPGDSCELKSQIRLIIEEYDKKDFEDTTIHHKSKMTVMVEKPPEGFIFTSSTCEFDDDVPCTVECEEIGDVRFACNLTLPTVDYNTSQLFDRPNGIVRFPPGNLSFWIRFNNGDKTVGGTLRADLPLFTIKPIPHCGDGKCENDVGESAGTCCLDCGCPGEQFCYNGAKENGECISSDSMLLNMYIPNPIECSVNLKKQCVSTQSFEVSALIQNPPAGFTKLKSSSYQFNDSDISETYCSVLNSTNQSINISCPILPPVIENGLRALRKVNRSLSLFVTVEYKEGETVSTRDLSATGTLIIKGNKSLDYINCEKTKADIDDLEDEIDKRKEEFTQYISAVVIIYAVCQAALDKGETAPWYCRFATAILLCLASDALTKYEEAKQELDQLKKSKESLCNADNVDGLRGGISSHGDFGNDMMGLSSILSLLCIVAMIWAISPGTGAGGAGADKPTGTGIPPHAHGPGGVLPAAKTPPALNHKVA